MKRSARRLLTLLLCACLITGLLPVTAWAASSFPSKFYAHLMNNSGMGTVMRISKLPTDAQDRPKNEDVYIKSIQIKVVKDRKKDL